MQNENGRFATRPIRPLALMGSRLRAARIAAGLSINQAAARLDISVMRYALLENGETTFERGDEAWAEALEVLRRPVGKA